MADVSVAVISEGSADENRNAFTEHGVERLLLQPGRDVAETYEAYGTPSAVLVSKDGIIASPVAQGAAAIRLLLSSAASMSGIGLN